MLQTAARSPASGSKETHDVSEGPADPVRERDDRRCSLLLALASVVLLLALASVVLLLTLAAVVLLVSLVSVLLLVFMVVITVFGVIFMVSKATLHAMPTAMAGGDTTITAR
jgi:fatty acid desaturase